MNVIVNIIKSLSSFILYGYYALKRAWLPMKDSIEETLRYLDTPRYRSKSYDEPTYNDDYSIRDGDEIAKALGHMNSDGSWIIQEGEDEEKIWDRESAPYCETP
jgi:hypothetical protein